MKRLMTLAMNYLSDIQLLYARCIRKPLSFLFSILFLATCQPIQAQFEFVKPLEEAPLTSDKYNYSSVVEGDDAYFFIYRLGGPDLIYDTHRFQIVKTDLEGNTLFQKEVIPPEGIDFFWGLNLATPPPMAYGEGRLSVLVSARVNTIDLPFEEYFLQLVFDDEGNLIQNNSFKPDLLQEFFEITATDDGFVFVTSPLYVDVPEAPTHLHVYKTDFDGNIIWEKSHQFSEGYNTIYLKDILVTSNSDIYIAMFNIPLAGGTHYGEALLKLDSEGDFIFVKRYIDPELIGGNIYNMSLAFQSHNDEDELYLMSSWTATINIHKTHLFKFADDGTLLDVKKLNGVEYASKLVAPSEGGATILIGKNGGDAISESFANWGDPVLIHFHPDLTVDWAYAYGGEEVHYTDDMVYNKDGNYFISARSETEAYMILTDWNGTSVCETKEVQLEFTEVGFDEEIPEMWELDISTELIEPLGISLSDIPFYDKEEKCCPFGLPEVSFEFSFGEEDGQLNFTNTSSNADSYDWTFGDAGSSIDESTDHQYDSPGLYEVCLMATNECGSVVFCEEILVEWSGVGLSEWEKDKIRIYSADDGIHIEMTELSGVDVQLRNMLGQVVYEQRNLESNTSLLLPKQEAGVYFCELIYEGEVVKMEKLFVSF